MSIPGVCILVVVLCAATYAHAEDHPRLALPIDCRIGETCVIQNYVDRDPGPGAVDFACGHRTYDGHKGTDFRLLDLAQMRRGVSVRASAPGVVAGTRNSMPDVNVREVGRAALKGRDCGNGVLIDHGGGWTTQSCHMKRGSIRVKKGERVAAGQVLGLVGLSGNTEFPHLHLSVTFNGVPVDPFVGRSAKPGCDATTAPLWRAPEADKLVYRGVGLLNAGFARGAPTTDGIENGDYPGGVLPGDAGALVFWVRLFGVRPGDSQRLTVYRPDGSVLAASTPKPVNRPKAQWMSFTGKRRPKTGAWPAGAYRGAYTLTRNGRIVVSVERSVSIR